ncbi:MAG: LCP family protein [Lysinibacillus sp.]
MKEKSRRSKEKKGSRKLWKWLVGGFFFIILVIAATTYISIQKTVDKMNTPLVENGEGKSPVVNVSKTKPFSVLLLGVDEREDDNGRSDTMIVVTVNPEKKSMKMLSIPRDTRTEIIGNDTVEKINHAYARGGVPMAMDTVENFIDIPIDNYVFINMEGFLQIIDTLGGITINNDMELTYDNYHFPKGEVNLTGEEALIFTRIRYEDPRGDFGRQIRQRQVIEAVMKKASNPSMLMKVDDVLDVVGENVRMNFAMSDLVKLQSIYKKMDGSIDQLSFEKGEELRLDKWYYIPDDEELLSIQTTLQEHLKEK